MGERMTLVEAVGVCDGTTDNRNVYYIRRAIWREGMMLGPGLHVWAFQTTDFYDREEVNAFEFSVDDVRQADWEIVKVPRGSEWEKDAAASQSKEEAEDA